MYSYDHVGQSKKCYYSNTTNYKFANILVIFISSNKTLFII